MKEKVKVSLVQFAPAWLEREKNAKRMSAFVEQEAARGAELIVFPEASNIGYITPLVPGELPGFDSSTTAAEFHVKYIKAAETIPGPTTELLGKVAKKRGVYIVVGMVHLHPVVPATLFNSAVLLGPSGIVGVHHKVHLPNNEKLYFYQGETLDVYNTELGNLGMMVCYDARFPEAARILALKGAEVICTVWNVPKEAGGAIVDPDGLKYRAYGRAQENGVYYLACNRAGKAGTHSFLGHSVIAGPNGPAIACSGSDQEEVLRGELLNDQLVGYRARWSIFRDRRPELYQPIVESACQTYLEQRPNLQNLQAAPKRLGVEKSRKVRT